MNELYTYPMPFDPFSYTEYTHAYLTYAGKGADLPVLRVLEHLQHSDAYSGTPSDLSRLFRKRLFQGRLWKTVEKKRSRGGYAGLFFRARLQWSPAE